jgi:hypothetical protein
MAIYFPDEGKAVFELGGWGRTTQEKFIFAKMIRDYMGRESIK